jgi:hypothetical protein
MVEVQLRPHTVPKKTPWGVVEKSLNQHIVLLKNQEIGEFVQCGYVGDTTFLPLAGFPQELCEPVAAACSKHLGKPVAAGIAPPGLSELVEIVNAAAGAEDDDE